jgi:hypothetical protein
MELSEEEMAALAEKLYEVHEAHRHLSGKAHYRHRMLVAVGLGVGIFAFYRVLHMEEALKGLEYLLPAVVDKLLFGLGE